MTKVYEEFLRGVVSAVIARLGERELKAEFAILVQGATAETEVSVDQLRREIARLIDDGNGIKEIAEILGARHGLAKREVYRLALEVRNLQRSGDRSG